MLNSVVGFLVGYRGVVLAMAGVSCVTGCAVYHPRPITPSETMRALRSHSLHSTGLREFVESELGAPLPSWPSEQWDLPLLTLAALYFHPDLEVARSLIDVADARIVTAGTLPNPTLAFTFRYNTDTAGKPGGNLARAVRQGVRDGALSGVDDATGGTLRLADTFGSKDPPDAESPWTFIYGVNIPVEWPWKRQSRITEAEKLAAAARLGLMETAWKTRSGVRKALIEHLLAIRQRALLRQEETVQARYVSLLEERLRLGDIVLPDIEAARIDHQRSRLELAASESSVEETRAGLAHALGLPLDALREVMLVLDDLESPPSADVLGRTIRDEALLNRFDIRRALFEYAAVEAVLQLEIAKQFPDLEIGPGYRWNQGEGIWTLGFSVPLPVFDRNQGPIAEAEARRSEAAARFVALQGQVIAAAENAHARLTGAHAEFSLSGAMVDANERREGAMRDALRLGEADARMVADAELQTILARRAVLDSLGRLHAAIGQVEDATQRPFEGLFPAPKRIESSPRSEVTHQ